LEGKVALPALRVTPDESAVVVIVSFPLVPVYVPMVFILRYSLYEQAGSCDGRCSALNSAYPRWPIFAIVRRRSAAVNP